MSIGALLLGAIVFTMWVWTWYLAMMNLKREMAEGDVTKIAKVFAWPSIIVGYISDILLNLLIGTIVFVQLPREWVFSARLIRNVQRDDFRGKIAKWFCRHFLDPFDPKGPHCKWVKK